MKESFKDKETAKKKVTRKANPIEAYGQPAKYPVESDEDLASKTSDGVGKANEIMAHGFDRMDFDMDMFDNERNYHRVCPDMGEVKDPEPNERAYNKYKPAPGYGAKEKTLDQDDEDYGHNVVKESNRLDD